MARWAAFLGYAGVLLALLLAGARLSTGVVRGENARFSLGSDGDAEATTFPPGDGTAPESETPARHADLPGQPAVSPADESVERPAESAADSADPSTVRTPRTRRPGRPADRTLAEAAEPVELSSATLLANVALTQGLLGAALVGGLVLFEVPLAALGVSADPWIGGPPAAALGLGFGLVLWVGNEAVASVADAVGATYDEGVREALAPDSATGWALLLGAILPTVAVVEELLFRGVMIGVPVAAFGVSPWLLAVVSSVAFALGHGAQGRVGIVVTGTLGFVLAAGYVLTGSLLVAIVAHYVVNAVEFLVHEYFDVDRALG